MRLLLGISPLVLLLLLVGEQRVGIAGGSPAPFDPSEVVARIVPPRPADAITGSEFARRTSKMRGAARQRAAVAEITRGNVPDFVRHLVPVELSGELHGETVQVVVWVIPDYLAIGSDDDFLRMPLTHPSATEIADRFDCLLPTTRIVDAIFEQAPHHLMPAPLPPGPKMRSSEYYMRHRQLIERQVVGIPPGELIAGHKKDVVLTGRLVQRRGRIAIYGWHRPNGKPIQPLSTVHDARYADYSHGLRLVYSQIRVQGEMRSLYEVLADPELAPLVSDEGAIPSAWELMHP
ncbi:MAG: hypothetical protein K8J08_15715 [Thermoanaerobaculia bacterium]|nr:hypothetical protein [Thermoanaerobaculia bacterium]